MSEDQLYPPPSGASSRAHVGSHQAYLDEYRRSIADPEAWWAAQAEEFHWYEKWHTVRDYNYDMDRGPVSIRWFDGGRTNIVHNCLDRHLEDRGGQTAIIWEGNRPDEDATLTFRELHEQVCRFANVLKSKGVKKGDRVSIYMPMIPELAVAMLACARIGAVHSIVFGGFSADSLADRIADSTCTVLITCNGTHRGDKPILLKPNADEGDGRGREADGPAGNQLHRRRAGRGRGRVRRGDEGRPRRVVARRDGRRLGRLPLRGDGRRGPPLHPLHLRLHREAEGRAAQRRRLHGLHRRHPQADLRLPTTATSTSAPPTSAGSPATPTSSTDPWPTAPRR